MNRSRRSGTRAARSGRSAVAAWMRPSASPTCAAVAEVVPCPSHSSASRRGSGPAAATPSRTRPPPVFAQDSRHRVRDDRCRDAHPLDFVAIARRPGPATPPRPSGGQRALHANDARTAVRPDRCPRTRRPPSGTSRIGGSALTISIRPTHGQARPRSRLGVTWCGCGGTVASSAKGSQAVRYLRATVVPTYQRSDPTS